MNSPAKERYSIKRRIAQGTFGIVYEGIDIESNMQVAIKVQKNRDSMNLDREVHMLTRLQGISGVPKLYWSGQENNQNVMVIQLLGRDLGYLMKHHRKFSLKCVLQLADQLITILSKVHGRSVLHRDLKPENIVVGHDREQGKIYLVDYGISKLFRDRNGRHMYHPQVRKSFVGTARYGSVAAHMGNELGRKDDLEQLIYILIFFAKGQLPWQNLATIRKQDRVKQIGDRKATINLKDLCRDLPDCFCQMLDYVRKLSFASDPDYDLMLKSFRGAATEANIQLDNTFDWCETAFKQQIQTSISIENLGLQPSRSSLQALQEQQKKSQLSNKLLPPSLSKNDSQHSFSNNSANVRYNHSVSSFQPLEHNRPSLRIDSSELGSLGQEYFLEKTLDEKLDQLNKVSITNILPKFHESTAYRLGLGQNLV